MHCEEALRCLLKVLLSKVYSTNQWWAIMFLAIGCIQVPVCMILLLPFTHLVKFPLFPSLNTPVMRPTKALVSMNFLNKSTLHLQLSLQL